MANRLVVSPAPHLHSDVSTNKIMRDVLIALSPAFIVSAVVYGVGAIVVTAVSVASCVVFEYLIQRFMLKGKRTVGDLSACVTGVLLAFNLPSSMPLWQVVIGALVAIGVGKMTFGGLGKNPFNPALVGRVFLLLSFPAAMTEFPSPTPDVMSGATPLTFVKGALKSGESVTEIMSHLSYSDLFLGMKGGSLGEIGVLALLLGFGYLLIRRVISWHIPIAVMGSMALFGGLMWWIDPQSYIDPLFHLITGGTVLGAVYMATDYATSPMSKRGMIIYGVGIGLITMFVRLWGAYPEGMSFAILIMNATVPLIDKYVRPKRFGVVKNKKG